MSRYLWATISLLAISSSSSANLARPKVQDASAEFRQAIVGAAADEEPTQAELTPQSEVFLNGKRTSYKRIPKTASVNRVVLASDGKTIVRIEFTTEKE